MNQGGRSWMAAAGGVAIMLGCGSGRMLPGPGARTVPGAPSAAFIDRNGLRLSADGDCWRGKPADLAASTTPVRVRIVNQTGRPIRVLYDSFVLRGPSGHRFRPLPPAPFEKGSEPQVPPFRPIFAHAGFFIAKAYEEMVPTLDPWPEPLPRNTAGATKRYRRWEPGLPTAEMRRMALFEGVLADGGKATGFLYFEHGARREGHLVFHADLVDARDGRELASLRIPFQIE
jgi:hypothetical protein